MNYIQKSYFKKYGNKDNSMEPKIIEDITYLVGQANSGSGNQQVLGASVWANGFKIVGCIGEDILLPENSTVEFTGPLAMCVGSTLTVPAETTLTIV